MSLALPVVHATPHPAPSGTPNLHFQRFGGREAVQRLVDAFYAAMDARVDAQVIRAMHAEDLADTRRVLQIYLCEWMGGPRDYSAERGTPKLRRRHQPFAIDDAARDAWMACMRQALAETCGDAALRHELEAAFAKVAEAMRNQPATLPSPHRSPP